MIETRSYADATPANNHPGGRMNAAAFVDASGNFWIFGGLGLDASGQQTYLNDLWKYDGVNWTYIYGSTAGNQSGEYGGANSVPGGRRSYSGWKDGDGNFWIFGGYGYDSAGTLGYLNDLWKYDGTKWLFISGGSLANQLSVYEGDAASIAPGGRHGFAVWVDSSGNFWFFGGLGYSELSEARHMNEIWKYTPSTNTWAWMGGSKIPNKASVDVTTGEVHPDNMPGARMHVHWWQENGFLHIFGGRGKNQSGEYGSLFDLWKLKLPQQ